MKLYEITGMFAELFEQFDELANYTPDTDEYGRYITEDGDVIDDLDAYREGVLTAWFDTLTAIEGEFNEKAVNIAIYIKNLNADIAAMKQEEAQLRERRRRCERQAEQMKTYLFNSMKAIGLAKIDAPRAKITLRKNPLSVSVDNEQALIHWAEEHDDSILKYEQPTVRKNEVKSLLNLGVQIPFVHLENKESVVIK